MLKSTIKFKKREGTGEFFVRAYQNPGVKIGDTRGCPLLGFATDMDIDSNFTVARSKEALKRIHRHLDAFFDEKGMDFSILVWWEVVKVPLIEFAEI